MSSFIYSTGFFSFVLMRIISLHLCAGSPKPPNTKVVAHFYTISRQMACAPYKIRQYLEKHITSLENRFVMKINKPGYDEDLYSHSQITLFCILTDNL